MFASVTAFASLLVLMIWFPKASAPAGEIVATGVPPPPSTPPPLRATVCGLDGASSPIASVAVFGPALSGRKET